MCHAGPVSGFYLCGVCLVGSVVVFVVKLQDVTWMERGLGVIFMCMAHAGPEAS